MHANYRELHAAHNHSVRIRTNSELEWMFFWLLCPTRGNIESQTSIPPSHHMSSAILMIWSEIWQVRYEISCLPAMKFKFNKFSINFRIYIPVDTVYLLHDLLTLYWVFKWGNYGSGLGILWLQSKKFLPDMRITLHCSKILPIMLMVSM